jgi:hypothetical protein
MTNESDHGGGLFPAWEARLANQMNWLERYRNGQSREVWGEMIALGGAVRDSAHFDEALAVARETMRRVRHNLEKARERLLQAGYEFADPAGAIVPPPPGTSRMIEEIQESTGPLPLSLRAFYEEVGSVDFRQSSKQLVHHSRPERDAAPELLVLGEEDPIQVFPLAELHTQSEGMGAAVYFCFAADEFHKADYSGGENYHVELPDEAADFRIVGMYGVDEYFVDYLRETCRFGGFRGKIELDPNDPDLALKPGSKLTTCEALGRGLLSI